MPNTNSNGYTIGFAVGMTVLVAVLLAGVATALKPMQDKNQLLDTKKKILTSVGYEPDKMTNKEVESLFDEKISSTVVNYKGEELEQEDALKIDVIKEAKLKAEDRRLPVFIYKEGDKVLYVAALKGSGLWDWISAYVAIQSDFNTIESIVFDHKAETPGLGAEIKDRISFREQFEGKKLYDEGGNWVSIDVKKGEGNVLDEHTVDGITGATMTTNGVEDMLKNNLKLYEAYWDQLKNTTNQKIWQ